MTVNAPATPEPDAAARVRRRFVNEAALMRPAAARLAAFARLHATFGDPPTTWRFHLQPFGFLVRCERAAAPERWCPDRHGPVELVLAADPLSFPLRPWQARLLSRRDVDVFNPHVASAGTARGAVCWSDNRVFAPLEWPGPAVLLQVLRILAGEVVALHGASLNEDAKAWFAAHRAGLPLARVPQPDGPWAPQAVHTGHPGQAAPACDPRLAPPCVESTLGIEFDDDAGGSGDAHGGRCE